jgi:dUTP pyrophosphatase
LIVKVFKLRDTAKLPERAHPTDAGIDLFYCPPSPNEWIVLKPGQSVVLETGLKIEVPVGHMIQIMNRSSIASKRQLITGACVVDRGYDGELFVNLQNIGNRKQILEPGMKIAQAVCVKVSIPTMVEIEEDNIYGDKTARGAGGFGSTDRGPGELQS